MGNLKHPRYRDPEKSVTEDDIKMSLPWRRSIITGSAEPGSSSYTGDERQEHVFKNMLADHTGHLENRCAALEQNCRNIEN